MNVPATICRPWNYYSAVSHCEDCDGKGHRWNGRGMGGNDPDSWAIPCETCEETGLVECPVCGFDIDVPGYDCLACETVNELSAGQLTDAVADKLTAAIKAAIHVAAKAVA